MYSTNITDSQWQVIEKNINVQERKTRHYLRGCGRGIRALARRMPDQISDASEQWIVVRSFSWLENFRRLTIDYEYLADTAETMVQLETVFILIFRINHVFSHQIFLFDTRIFLFIHFSNTYNMTKYIFAV